MRIIIVDDDAIVSASLQTILEATGQVEVVGSGENGEEAVALFLEHEPDIVLMDIQMPVKDGLTAAKEILKIDGSSKILFLTTFSDNDYIVEALRLGAKGYILKQEFAGIAVALQTVMNGQSVFGTDIVTKLPNLLQENQGTSLDRFGLSEKEMEIIQFVAKGLNNKEMSQALFLSEGTVRNYLSGILEKLKLRDRTQLAIFYYQQGMNN